MLQDFQPNFYRKEELQESRYKRTVTRRRHHMMYSEDISVSAIADSQNELIKVKVAYLQTKTEGERARQLGEQAKEQSDRMKMLLSVKESSK